MLLASRLEVRGSPSKDPLDERLGGSKGGSTPYYPPLFATYVPQNFTVRKLSTMQILNIHGWTDSQTPSLQPLVSLSRLLILNSRHNAGMRSQGSALPFIHAGCEHGISWGRHKINFES